MKILFQSDDYGMSKAQALGCIEGIKNGLIRNTGIFTNMPCVDEVAQWIKPYLNDIALGIDLNLSTGPAILGKDKIPSLLQDDGKTFKTSSQNRALDTDENDHDHVNYEQAYAELDAQIQKYIELFDKLPDYLHMHAYLTKTITKVHRDLAKKYGIIYSADVTDSNLVCGFGPGWYKWPPTLDNQRNSSLEEYILNDEAHFLTSDKEYGILICHSGYVEADLFDLSSFSIYRCMDLKGLTSPKVLKWVKDNNIELITYKDLKGII